MRWFIKWIVIEIMEVKCFWIFYDIVMKMCWVKFLRRLKSILLILELVKNNFKIFKYWNNGRNNYEMFWCIMIGIFIYGYCKYEVV